MKPQIVSNALYLLLTISLLILSSCRVEKPEVLEDENIRVIELELKSTKSDIELDATREELSRYDCDLNWILFDYNSDQLSNEAKLELEKVALIIEQNDNFKARIRAFTDSKGRREYNQELSSRRANSAKQYLLSEGINERNISIDAYAEAKPIAINTEDDTGRQYNRRIELFVIDKLNNTVCRSHPPKIPNSLKLEIQ